MAHTLYTISSVKTGSTVINQIESSSYNHNLAQILLTGSGNLSPGFVAFAGAVPELTFSTTAIKASLNAFVTASNPMDGIAISASSFLFYLQQVKHTGTRYGATSHIKATAVAGMVIPVSLDIPHQGPAMLNYRAVFTSADGSAAPLAFAGSQDLDASIAAAAEAYVLGGVSLNGSTLDGVSNVSFNFGNQVIVDGGTGLTYPTFVGIMSRRPSVSISTNDLDDFVSWGIFGQAQDAADSVITLTGLDNGGTLDGADQITLTIDAGVMNYDGFTGSDGSKAGGTVTITPTYDGTNEIVVFSVPA